MRRTRTLDLVFALLLFAAVAAPRTTVAVWDPGLHRWIEAPREFGKPDQQWYPAGQRRLLFQLRQWNSVKETPDLIRMAMEILVVGSAAAIAALFLRPTPRPAAKLASVKSQPAAKKRRSR